MDKVIVTIEQQSDRRQRVVVEVGVDEALCVSSTYIYYAGEIVPVWTVSIDGFNLMGSSEDERQLVTRRMILARRLAEHVANGVVGRWNNPREEVTVTVEA